MQRFLLGILLSFITFCAFGQSNTFPSSGAVGIGTTSPISGTSLTVTNGHINYSSSYYLYSGRLYLQGTNSTNNNHTRANFSSNVYWDNTVTNGNGGTGGWVLQDNATSTDFAMIRMESGGQIGFFNKVSEGSSLSNYPYPDNQSGATSMETYRRFTIKNTGRIGIGTANPGAFLEISGDVTAIPHLIFTNTISGNKKWQLTGSANDFTITETGVGTRMWFQAGGNIGIGTANPKSLLAVNGTVTAKKIVVTQDASFWADYVFAPGYKLRSLPAVASYIKTNGHLPDVPSAAEVAKNGVDVSSTQANLLQKIEELTLYAIDQDKKIAAQAQLLKEQQALLLELQKQMDEIKAGKK